MIKANYLFSLFYFAHISIFNASNNQILKDYQTSYQVLNFNSKIYFSNFQLMVIIAESILFSCVYLSDLSLFELTVMNLILQLVIRKVNFFFLRALEHFSIQILIVKAPSSFQMKVLVCILIITQTRIVVSSLSSQIVAAFQQFLRICLSFPQI